MKPNIRANHPSGAQPSYSHFAQLAVSDSNGTAADRDIEDTSGPSDFCAGMETLASMSPAWVNIKQ